MVRAGPGRAFWVESTAQAKAERLGNPWCETKREQCTLNSNPGLTLLPRPPLCLPCGQCVHVSCVHTGMWDDFYAPPNLDIPDFRMPGAPASPVSSPFLFLTVRVLPWQLGQTLPQDVPRARAQQLPNIMFPTTGSVLGRAGGCTLSLPALAWSS